MSDAGTVKKKRSAKSGRANKKTAVKFWVGLGASAGGLEALRGLVRKLPDDLPATYIVAQHMAPHHKSMLTEIIGRETNMPVVEIEDGITPEANAIYITPPNQNIILDGNKVRLIDPDKKPGAPKPSVDDFLTSLSEVKKQFAIGIILSGTGSDGSKGIRAVQEAGGITIAQDELTAKYSSMPQTAIETGCVELIMSPEEMGAQMAKIIALPRDLDSLKNTNLSHDSLGELMQLLLDQTRVDFRYYKSATFQRRIERRMASVKVSSLDDYVDLARTSEKEVQALFQDLLISVTSFFRDPVEFDQLNTHIDEMVRNKEKGVLRVWIPGTATGEEAYSIAILFTEAIKKAEAEKRFTLQIFATDIDANAIEIARRGFYSRSSLDEVSDDLVEKYFDAAPSGYIVKKALREKIVFSLHNIAQDPPFLNVDMISCRNLLIYFQTNLQQEVFNRFHYSLVPNGLLFLGKSEAVTASQSLFTPAGNDKHIFFQRPSREKKPPRDLSFTSSKPTIRPVVPSPTLEMRKLRGYQQQFDSLAASLGNAAILIDDDMTILKAFGELGDYLSVSAGVVDTKLTSLLKSPFKEDIQATAPGVIRNNSRANGYVRFDPINSKRRVKVSVYPVEDIENGETMALAVFDEWEEDIPDFSDEKIGDGKNSEELRNQIFQLTNELAIAKTNLQQTVEELETSNEELQALNEELQSSNEELQSTNEELETSNEELQSTNEELSTVNEELHVNAQQLSTVNLNLSSVLENVTVPLLVVDRNLNITNASDVAEKFFGIPTDTIMPNVVNCKTKKGYPNLVESLRAAIESREAMQWEINSDGQSATLKIAPHISTTDELLGAIVIVNDNTEELARVRNELQLIIENAPISLMLRDKEGVILQANQTSQTLLEADGEDMKGTSFYDYFDEKMGAQLKKADAKILKSKKPILGLDMQAHYHNGVKKWVRTNRIPAPHPSKDELAIYSVAQDITEQYESVQALKVSELRTDIAVTASNMGLWDRNLETDEVYWSDRIFEILGADKTQNLDEMLKHIHPDDRDMVQKTRKNHLAKKEPYDVVYRVKQKDGSYVWVQSNAQATWDAKGKPLRLTGTLRDITEEREMLFSIDERREQLEQAAQLSGVGYWRIDLEQNTLFWSEQVHHIHGTDPETYVPDLEKGIDFYHEEDKALIEKYVGDAIEKATGFKFSARIRRKDGDVRNVESVGTCHTNKDGKTAAVFGVFLDVTEERRKQESLENTLMELARSNEELNRFSYVCSHDMKEPVRMIEAMANLLVDPKFNADDKKRNELLERIGTNTTRLRGIIDSLLAYSRIDAKIDVEPVNLNKVVEDITESISLAISEQNAKVEVADLPTVQGAYVHFTQLFQNLIGNALKFSDNKKPLVKISAMKEAKGWRILLEDNGPGIPEEARAEVFNLFSRLQRRDEIEGTGLGLSIAQRIVMQYGGGIQCVDSSLGGAAFNIFLPFMEDKDD